jgi:hypothetical protein
VEADKSTNMSAQPWTLAGTTREMTGRAGASGAKMGIDTAGTVLHVAQSLRPALHSARREAVADTESGEPSTKVLSLGYTTKVAESRHWHSALASPLKASTLEQAKLPVIPARSVEPVNDAVIELPSSLKRAADRLGTSGVPAAATTVTVASPLNDTS